MSLWLSKKKKQELVDLCSELGLPVDARSKKFDLEGVLTDHLDANEDALSSDPTFAPYYDTVAVRSSVKRSPAKSVISAVAVDERLPSTRTRRRTSRYVPGSTAFEEMGGTTADETTPEPPSTERKLRAGSRALATRTPRTMTRTLREAQQVPLPPTPAAVADVIESRTNQAFSQARKAVRDAAIEDRARSLRDALSNVVSVNTVALLLEMGMMLVSLIPWSKELAIPAVAALGTRANVVYLPDLFVLVTPAFWAPFMTWALMAVGVPYANSKLFNLVSNSANVAPTPLAPKDGPEYQFDPLTFAVTKALMTYLVKSGFRFGGLVGDSSVRIVMQSVGPETQYVGAAIAALAAVWEGILKR